jgi:exosortase
MPPANIPKQLTESGLFAVGQQYGPGSSNETVGPHRHGEGPATRWLADCCQRIAVLGRTGGVLSRLPSGVDPVSTQATAPIPIRRWALGVLAVMIAVLYAGTLVRLVSDWLHDPNYSHGILVAPFSAYLVWRNRGTLRLLPIRPTWWGLAGIVGALVVLVVGKLGAELFLSRSSLVLLIAAMVLFFAGWRWLRALAFPLAFLFLMIPIPALIFDQISLPLQFFASHVASALLTLIGVPVLREGNIIHLPALTLEVAEACSGIRSLISLLALAIIYGYFVEFSLWRRVVLAASAVPIAVLANALRIMGTGMLVEYWSPEWAAGFFHAFSGWLVFIAALLLLFAFHNLLHLSIRRVSHA